jgi:predicted dehydrogenase
MSRLRIAVVGAGLIGRAHIDVLRTSSECALQAIVDPSPEASTLAGQHQVPWFGTLDELLVRNLPDALIIATPNHLHVKQAHRCLDAGLPVLLEKPVAPTAAEGELLRSVVERTGIPVLIGHHRAHGRIMARAREIVNDGRLGRLVTVMGSAVFYKPDDYFSSAPWRTRAGGGPILINLIHEIHNLRMLMGEISAVQAFSSNAVRRFQVEDTVAINLRFANDALGTFMLSDTAACARSWEQTSGENPTFAYSPDEDCYVITGTRGSLSIPSMRLNYHRHGEDASWLLPLAQERIAIEPVDPLVCQLAHFAAVIRSECAPLVSVADGLANLRVVEAIAHAARSGQAVELSG